MEPEDGQVALSAKQWLPGQLLQLGQVQSKLYISVLIGKLYFVALGWFAAIYGAT